MQIAAVEWKDERIRIIDQTLLPLEVRYLDIDDVDTMVEAIQRLRVRGAPAIGIAAAYGLVVGMRQSGQGSESAASFAARLEAVTDKLARSRPTAVNLFWALDRVKRVGQDALRQGVEQARAALLAEAKAIHEEDRQTCQRMGEHGAALLSDGDGVLTHCNTGALATGGIGTAYGVIYTAVRQGKDIRVYADETRPLLQGARLTAWEFMQHGIDVTLICDNTAAFLMQQGRVQAAIVGADRIAANGDTANKIGTYGVAVLAHHHGVPFYVAAPLSTFDFDLNTGADIPIEERAAEEVTEGFGRRTAPVAVPVYSPAFDVTPARLVTGYVTEVGVLTPPFDHGLKASGK